MDIKIKEMDISDLVISGFSETLTNLRPVGDMSQDMKKTILEKINSQNGHIFIAICDGKVVGTTTVLIEQKFIRGGAKVAHIEDVSTRKDFEGHGIASTILKRCISYAKEMGCYKVILDCGKNVIPFYERYGFKSNENHMRLDL